SSFHVIFRALIRNEPDEQIEVERWTIGDAHYDTFIGNLTLRGNPPDSLGSEWFHAFEAVVRDSRLAGDLHWLRLYFGQWKNEPRCVEVLLDNDTWEPVQQRMVSFDWPKSEEFYSARHFMILRRVT